MVALVLAAIIAGALGWSGSVWTLPASLLFPCLWTRAKSRREAALVAFAYYGAASRGLAVGAATFFHSLLVIGVAIWLAGNLVVTLPWMLLWTPRYGWRTALAAVAIVVTALPPIGIAGWANPITAAGVLFPGWKWAGLIATLVFIMILCVLGINQPPRRAFFFQAVLVWLASLAAIAFFPQLPAAPHGWCGCNTHFAEATGQPDYLKDYARISHLAAVSLVKAKRPGSVVVFPESACGQWGHAGRMVWKPTQKVMSGTVLFGADLFRKNGKYDNDLVLLDHSGDRVLYRQRMPVPISMWRPWSKSNGANAYWFRQPVFSCAGLRSAALICYEQFLVWPVLESMWERPQVIISVGNDWWGKGTNLSRIQRASSMAWARLFDARFVAATNS